MVATLLSGIVLAAIITAFLYIGKASIGLRNYADMETQARNAMETFAQDVRMSSAVVWNSDKSLTLTIEQGGTTTNATYTYNTTAAGSAPANSFTRTVGTNTRVLITNVRSFSYNAYGIDTQSISLGAISASTNAATKQVQISLETQRTQSALALASNKVISARFVLRNKHVTS